MSESDVKGVKVNGAIDHSDSSTVPKAESPGRDVVADVLATKPGLGNGMNADTKSVQDDEEVENDSEAETLIQSPEKKRGVAEVTANGPNYKTTDASDAGSVVLTNASDKENASRKRKRFQDDGEQSRRSRNSSRHSSPLSSPSAHVSDNESARFRHDVRRKRPQEADGSPTSDKDVDISKKRRRRPSEILPPSLSHKRSKQGSIDATERRETRSATYSRPSDDERSPSPESRIRREHRRGASTQLTAHDLDRKKRGRPPNIQTRRNRSVDRASESSDDSGPRSRSRPQVHKFASQDHDTMSPAKVGPRKWKDKNGRTHLARACANEDLEMARAKLAERPGDLNMADNAGNTPLQIASLEGFESIVEFLLQAGAEVNVRNLDRDSPLIDAVENGHIEVIKLLLRHGANPRMGNGKGDEPLELVHPDDENRDIIRKMLNDAKDKISKKLPVTDIDISTRDNNSSRAASAASPRESPPVGTRSPPAAFGSRRRTGRSESTRNDLLWQANTQENLAKLASRGDVQGVVNILSILEKADTEALIAAAKAGHEEILQMLIAMGKPSPDPGPVPGYKGGPMFATPMLAAIGRGHPDVVKLLANQPGFNPMRRYKDRHYFELAKERRGEKWQQEYEILKQAYDKHAIARGKKTASPRKNRDGEKVKNRPPRRSVSPNSVKRQSSSPTITHKQLPKSTDTDKEKRKSTGSTGEKRKSTGSHEASEGSIAVASDIDQRVSVEKKTHRTRRSQSDLPPLSSIEDAPHKRRRLVTGKEHRKAQQSSSSSEDDDDMPEVKQEDKSQVALKRPRPSHSSDEVNAEGRESHEARATNKKRRTVLESSPDELRSFTKFSEPSAVSLSEERMPTENKSANTLVVAKTSAIDAPPAATEDKVVTKPKRISASPPKKTEAIAPPPPPPRTPLEAQIGSMTDAQPTIEKTADVMSVTTLQENDESKAELESRTKLSEERKAREEEDKKVAAAAKIAEEARIKQEQAKIKAELEAKQKAEEQERIKQQRELEQREASQAAEREAQRRAKVEEEQRKRRQEEEEQERVAQAQKAKEDQRLRDEEEAERLRTEALPIVLCRTIQMLKSGDVAVRNPDWLSKFLPLYTVKAKQLDPLCDAARANDDWIPNFQVAGLFLTTDLSLREFAQLERRPTTDHQRECLWRVARLKLSYDFDSTWATTVTKATEIESVAQKKFFEMPDLFWVKLSDVLGQILDMPHLNGLDLPRQPISLKTYDEVFGARIKALNTLPPRPHALPNGISTTSTIVTNGGNGTIH